MKIEKLAIILGFASCIIGMCILFYRTTKQNKQKPFSDNVLDNTRLKIDRIVFPDEQLSLKEWMRIYNNPKK